MEHVGTVGNRCTASRAKVNRSQLYQYIDIEDEADGRRNMDEMTKVRMPSIQRFSAERRATSLG